MVGGPIWKERKERGRRERERGRRERERRRRMRMRMRRRGRGKGGGEEEEEEVHPQALLSTLGSAMSLSSPTSHTPRCPFHKEGGVWQKYYILIGPH